MATYATVRELSDTDAAYIAGLIDGEGSVTLTREHQNERRRLVVSIANTELQILEFVLDAAGAGRITSKRTYSSNHTPSHAYKITNWQALALLRQVAPFMKSYKRQRAELVVRHYVELTPRNGRYDDAAALRREQFERELLAIVPGAKPPDKSAASSYCMNHPDR